MGVLHMGHMLNNTIQDVLIRRARMHFYLAYVHDESKHLEWYCSTCVPCAKLPSRSAVELQWYRALCHLVHCGNSFSPSSVYTIFLLTSVVRMFWEFPC